MANSTIEASKAQYMNTIAVVLAILGFLAAITSTGNLIDGLFGAVANGAIGLLIGFGVDKVRRAR